MTLLLGLLAPVGAIPGSAAATTPGGNDRIVFSSDRNGELVLFTMDADGSDPVQLTSTPGGDAEPAWSPDGTKVAFGRYDGASFEIFSINADGTGLVDLTNSPSQNDFHPSWSRDGTMLAFSGCCLDGPDQIYVMQADGSGQTPLDALGDEPAWSPNDDTIAFRRPAGFDTQLWTMRSDGTRQRQIADLGTTGVSGWPAWSPDGTRLAVTIDYHTWVIARDGSNPIEIAGTVQDLHPNWSPDGTRILFTGYGSDPYGDIYSVGLDGAGLSNLTDLEGIDSMPNWQSRPCTMSGTAGDDTLFGTNGDDVICGLGGNDLIEGGPGRDLILGGAGNDILSGGAGNDQLVGEAGEDTLLGESGSDRLAAIDFLGGNDRLDGGSGRSNRCWADAGDVVRNCG